MRAGKRNSMICYVMIAVLLLTGMCFDPVRSDSYDTYPGCFQAADAFYFAGSVLTSVDSCTPKMLGQPDSDTVISHAGKPAGRISFRPVQTIWFLRNSFFTLIIILLTAGIGISTESASHAVIVTYIHQKDGKKR